MADLFDRFSGSATNISAHPADTGQSYAPITPGVLATNGSGALYVNVINTTGLTVSSWTPPSADYAASAVVGAGAATNDFQFGPMVRATGTDTASISGYFVLVLLSANLVSIRRFNSGALGFVGDGTITSLAANDVITLTAVGSSPVVLTVYKNGTLLTTQNDSSGSKITATGSAGLFFYDGSTSGAGTDMIRAFWAGAVGGPTETITPTAPAVIWNGTQGFTAATVETNEVINWTCSAGSCSPTTGATTTWTAPSSGGSATITWTSADLPTHTASTTATLSSGSGATSYTLTNASPSSGPPNASSANFTVQLDGNPTPSCVITPHSSVGGDAFTLSSLTISDALAHTFTLNGSATAGARTISVTHTGGGFVGDPASVVYTVVAATSYTLTAASPASGHVHNASTAFTVQLDAIPTAACVVTPNDSSGGGVFSPTSRTISDAASYTFTYTPGTVGTKTIGVTHTGGGFSGNPASVTYTSTPQTLAVGPSAITTSGTTTVTWTGGGTFWTSSAPTFTPTGVAGVSVGSVTVTSDTSASATVTTGPTGGTITWTDSTTSATATQIVAIVEHALSTGQGFPSGLTDIGYAVYRIDGSGPLAAWTSVDVYELAPGAGDYGADVSYPADGSDYRITWSRGNATTPPYAHDVVSSIPVPPTTAEIAQAVLTNTTFLTTVGSLGGLVVAIDAKTTNLPASPAATGGQMVLSASGLDLIASGDPGPIASQTTFPKKLMALYRRFFGPSSLNTQLKTYADNGTTVNSTQAVTDDGTTQTYGKAT